MVESTTGETDPRPRIIGLALLAVALLSGTQAYKLRGPLRIGRDSVAQAKYVVPLHGATVDVNEGKARSPAAVTITPAQGATTQLTNYSIDPWNYGLDVNTVASALNQMVRWLDAGRTASPFEILSMLTVEPTANVPLGALVDIPMVTGGSTRR